MLELIHEEILLVIVAGGKNVTSTGVWYKLVLTMTLRVRK